MPARCHLPKEYADDGATVVAWCGVRAPAADATPLTAVAAGRRNPPCPGCVTAVEFATCTEPHSPAR